MIEEGANINAKVERIDKTVRQEKRLTQNSDILLLKNLRKKKATDFYVDNSARYLKRTKKSLPMLKLPIFLYTFVAIFYSI